MRIAICDDEAVQLQLIANYVEEYQNIYHQPLTIECYSNADALLFAYQEDYAIPILLLDIQMKGLNGMELAKLVRKYSKDKSSFLLPVSVIMFMMDLMYRL